MAQAGQNQVLVVEQYRSQKGKAAGIQCLNKRLFYDYIQEMCNQQPYALMMLKVAMTTSY